MTRLVLLWGCLISPIGGCVHPDDVKFRMTNDATEHGQRRPIEDLRVYAGGSKAWWDVVAPGDSVGVFLRPEGELPQVTISYKVAGRTLRWKGPEIARGVGYAISIHVGANGAVTENHCRFPCFWP